MVGLDGAAQLGDIAKVESEKQRMKMILLKFIHLLNVSMAEKPQKKKCSVQNHGRKLVDSHVGTRNLKLVSKFQVLAYNGCCGIDAGSIRVGCLNGWGGLLVEAGFERTNGVARFVTATHVAFVVPGVSDRFAFWAAVVAFFGGVRGPTGAHGALQLALLRARAGVAIHLPAISGFGAVGTSCT